MQRIVECVPNFSEGRDHDKIRSITEQIEAVPGSPIYTSRIPAGCCFRVPRAARCLKQCWSPHPVGSSAVTNTSMGLSARNAEACLTSSPSTTSPVEAAWGATD